MVPFRLEFLELHQHLENLAVPEDHLFQVHLLILLILMVQLLVLLFVLLNLANLVNLVVHLFLENLEVQEAP